MALVDGFRSKNWLRKSFSPFSTSVHSIWFVDFDLSCSAATHDDEERLPFCMCMCICMCLLAVHIIQLVHRPYCNFYEKSELFNIWWFFGVIVCKCMHLESASQVWNWLCVCVFSTFFLCLWCTNRLPKMPWEFLIGI